MTEMYLIAAACAAACFYLATSHQAFWRPARRYAVALRCSALLACTVCGVAAVSALGLWAGLFAGLTVLMLVCVALPFLDAFRRRRHVG